MKKYFSLLIIIIMIWTIPVFAQSYNLTFAWDKNIETDLAGYRLYKSDQSNIYDPNTYIEIDLPGLVDPNNPIYELKNIPTSSGKLYYVLTAYDTWNNESPYSNEISFEPDVMSPASPSNLSISVTLNININ